MVINEFKVIYSGKLGIDYGQFYVDVDDDEVDYLDPDGAFENQVNGICGAAQKGKLFLVAGIQGGVIEIEVQLHASEPSIENSYEEIVEANIEVDEQQLMLCEWAHEDTHNLSVPPQEYIVRYCIKGMDKDYEDDSDWESPLPGQMYLLQFWPGIIERDKVIKCTSESAKYWHREWGGA